MSVVQSLPNRCDQPGCGESFPTVQGLGRHRQAKHGVAGTSPTVTKEKATHVLPPDVKVDEIVDVVAFMEGRQPESVFAELARRWAAEKWKDATIRKIVLARKERA